MAHRHKLVSPGRSKELMQLVEDFFLDQRYHFGIQSYVMRAVRIGRRCSSTVAGLSLNEITSRSLQNLKTRVGISGVLWKPSQVSDFIRKASRDYKSEFQLVFLRRLE